MLFWLHFCSTFSSVSSLHFHANQSYRSDTSLGFGYLWGWAISNKISTRNSVKTYENTYPGIQSWHISPTKCQHHEWHCLSTRALVFQPQSADWRFQQPLPTNMMQVCVFVNCFHWKFKRLQSDEKNTYNWLSALPKHTVSVKDERVIALPKVGQYFWCTTHCLCARTSDASIQTSNCCCLWIDTVHCCVAATQPCVCVCCCLGGCHHRSYSRRSHFVWMLFNKTEICATKVEKC